MMQMLGFRGSASKETSDSSPKSLSQNPKSSSPTVVAAGPGRPLRLVYCDDKGKFRMDPEAVAALQLVKGPIGVVSVCGRARQGKSFILNQLLGRSSGFQVASTHRPCTKGLWMWSAPLKRTALDGTEYYLVLLDSEGIDAYDQTGTYSTQIFSLAVLLSSMFIYNQMGGIDETALDRLSLVTEMTKHIRVRASGGRTTASELGQFSPVFVWLLRDFYLDLAEDDRKITPRDYLELALRPMQGGKDVATKNEIRESIRSLFPDRECFTLVRPLNNENDLQRLDQISLEKLRPEFRSGLDALTKFVFERTRTKQVGATVMTGPILAGITQSFLDAINNGAVPTISSSWQSVEEAECRSAYETATDVYMASFDRTKPPEEGVLREEQGAVQKSLAVSPLAAIGDDNSRGDESDCQFSESLTYPSQPTSPLTSVPPSHDWSDMGPITLFQEDIPGDVIDAEPLQMRVECPHHQQEAIEMISSEEKSRAELFDSIQNKKWIRDGVGHVGRTLGLTFRDRPEDTSLYSSASKIEEDPSLTIEPLPNSYPDLQQSGTSKSSTKPKPIISIQSKARKTWKSGKLRAPMRIIS